MTGLQKAIAILKVIITIFILKVVLGSSDVGSDMVNGSNTVSGEAKLGLYFASETKEVYNQLPDMTVWGYQTLCLPWLPGLLRISFIAAEVKWTSLKCIVALKKIAGFVLLFIGWPLFAVFM